MFLHTFHFFELSLFLIWSHIWHVMNWDTGIVAVSCYVLRLGLAGLLAVPCLASLCSATTTRPPSAAGGGCAAAVVVAEQRLARQGTASKPAKPRQST